MSQNSSVILDTAWDVPEGEELDLEKAVFGDDEIAPSPTPELEVEVPSNLLPPSTVGVSAARLIAVRAYKRAQMAAGWPTILTQDEVRLDLLLTSTEERMVENNVGDIVVMSVEGPAADARKDPLLLTTWLACLRKYEEYATIVEETAPG